MADPIGWLKKKVTGGTTSTAGGDKSAPPPPPTDPNAPPTPADRFVKQLIGVTQGVASATTDGLGNIVDAYGPVSGAQTDADRIRNLELYNRALKTEGTAPVRYDIDPNAKTYDARQVQGTGNVEAPDMAPTERVTTRDVDAPDLGNAAQVAAQQPGAIERALAERVAGTKIATGPGDQVRSQTLGLAQDLRDAASGKGPSVATDQFHGALADVARQVSGKAATARGSNRAYARLAANKEIADMGRRAAFDAGQIRAGEALGARGQLGGLLSDTRGMDTSLATDQARLTQAADTTSAELGTRVSESNAGAANRRDEVAAQLRLEAAKANQDAINRRTEVGAGMELDANTGNADRSLTGATTNADAANARAIEEARQKLAAATGNRDATLDTQKTNATLGQAADKDTADARNRREEVVAGGNLDAATTNKTSDQRTKEFTQTAAQDASNAASGDTAVKLGVETDNKDRKRGAIGDLATGLQVASDERLKEDIEEVDPKAAQRLAKMVDIISFKYRGDPKHDEHVGVSAQQLEKDPLGEKFVSKGSDGMRKVNYGEMIPALLLAGLKGKREAGARR